jgi:chitin synthase
MVCLERLEVNSIYSEEMFDSGEMLADAAMMKSVSGGILAQAHANRASRMLTLADMPGVMAGIVPPAGFPMDTSSHQQRPTSMLAVGTGAMDGGYTSSFSPVGVSNRNSMVQNRFSMSHGMPENLMIGDLESPMIGAVPSSPSLSMNSPTMPSDSQLQIALRNILASTDLMTTTKREVRAELSRMFGGIDLRSRRDSINDMINEILDAQKS